MQDLSNLTLRMKATIKIMIAFPAVALCLTQQQQSPPAQAQLAHFHHVHINAIDPEASIRFYTSHFNSERVKLEGTIDAVWAQKSWLLLNKVNRPENEFEYATRKLIHATNEIFMMFLRDGPYSEYIHEVLGASY
jgi:hypothetical protein